MRKIEVGSIVLYNRDENNPLKVFEISGATATCYPTADELSDSRRFDLYLIPLLMDIRDFWDEKAPGWESPGSRDTSK